MMKITQAASERHVLTITVDNEAGILAKIAGLFTARGYNIDSLTVADISENHAVSRITIVTHGPPAVIDQIRAQLERLRESPATPQVLVYGAEWRQKHAGPVCHRLMLGSMHSVSPPLRPAPPPTACMRAVGG